MTEFPDTTLFTEPRLGQAVRRAAVRATLAPSIHNTQPWRFVLGRCELEVYADWDRRLRVLDPRGRQLLISCGCALFNARVALTAAGYEAKVDRFPDPLNPNLLARLRLEEPRIDQVPIGMLDPVVELRRTNRRFFDNDLIPPEVIEALIRAANDEGAELIVITGVAHRRAVDRLIQQAEDLELADPAYRAELRAWTSADPARLDGVFTVPGPHTDGAEDHPNRGFDAAAPGGPLPGLHFAPSQCLLLLCTRHDSPAAWLRAGEAMERVLLEITRHGYAASPLTQVIEVAQTNAQLCEELQLSMYPHTLLRVGRASLTTASRRRRLGEVLDVAG